MGWLCPQNMDLVCRAAMLCNNSALRFRLFMPLLRRVCSSSNWARRSVLLGEATSTSWAGTAGGYVVGHTVTAWVERVSLWKLWIWLWMEICAAVVEEFDIWVCELWKLGVSRGLSWRDAAARGNQSSTVGMWCIETSERFGLRNTKRGFTVPFVRSVAFPCHNASICCLPS